MQFPHHLKIISLVTSLSTLLIVIACNSDDSDEPDIDKNFLAGVFIDSPVQGLTFMTDDTLGVTGVDGSFIYEQNQNLIEFKIGGLSLGSVSTGPQITPIDFGGSGSTIYTPIVKNISALLQSLDNDANPSNGIKINAAVALQMQQGSLNLQSGTFPSDLSNLINSINTSVGSNLEFVHPNAAAEHLAKSLGLENQLEFRPTVKAGRRWEDGLYFSYNTDGYGDPDGEYTFNIMGDSVVYHFGGGTAYLMNMEYVGDTLYGYGNIYNYIGTDSMYTNFEYSNRKSSPGFVVDHNDTTFIGYYNYLKVLGDNDKIEGVYESYLVFDRKFPNGTLNFINVLNDRLEISSPDEDDSLTFTNFRRNADTTIITKIHKQLIKDDKIFLVDLEGSSILFAERSAGFFPGLISYKD